MNGFGILLIVGLVVAVVAYFGMRHLNGPKSVLDYSDDEGERVAPPDRGRVHAENTIIAFIALAILGLLAWAVAVLFSLGTLASAFAACFILLVGALVSAAASYLFVRRRDKAGAQEGDFGVSNAWVWALVLLALYGSLLYAIFLLGADTLVQGFVVTAVYLTFLFSGWLMYDAGWFVRIPPAHIGVVTLFGGRVTSIAGTEAADPHIKSEQEVKPLNIFTKFVLGMQPATLGEGLHFLPFPMGIILVNLQVREKDITVEVTTPDDVQSTVTFQMILQTNEELAYRLLSVAGELSEVENILIDNMKSVIQPWVRSPEDGPQDFRKLEEQLRVVSRKAIEELILTFDVAGKPSDEDAGIGPEDEDRPEDDDEVREAKRAIRDRKRRDAAAPLVEDALKGRGILFEEYGVILRKLVASDVTTDADVMRAAKQKAIEAEEKQAEIQDARTGRQYLHEQLRAVFGTTATKRINEAIANDPELRALYVAALQEVEERRLIQAGKGQVVRISGGSVEGRNDMVGALIAALETRSATGAKGDTA